MRAMAGAIWRASRPATTSITRRYAMKPATPMPMISRPSMALATAMMPRNTFVVPSSPDMPPPLERRRLARRLVPRRLEARLAHRFVQQLPAFAGDAGGFGDGGAEAVQLPREIVERRLEVAAQSAPFLGEEQVTGDTADHGADDRRCQCTRVAHEPPPRGGFLQVWCHEKTAKPGVIAWVLAVRRGEPLDFETLRCRGCRRVRRGLRPCRLAAIADVVLLHLAVERRPVQPENLRRLLFVPI